MGIFAKRVQSQAIAGPLRRRFTEERWQQEIREAVEPDIYDLNVYEAGLAIHQKLEKIRGRLKLSTSAEISATTKLRSFVAAANHNFIVAQNKTAAAMAEAAARLKGEVEEVFLIDELMAVNLKLPGGMNWSPHEIVEALVDGLEVPVRYILKDAPDLSGTPSMRQVEWNDIARELNLGLIYRFAEDVWEDCLWNGYGVVESGGWKVFVPGDRDIIVGHRVGIARRIELTAAFNFVGGAYHRELLKRGMQLRIRDVKSIERVGKRQIISLAAASASTEAHKYLLSMQALASEPYYSDLLNEMLPVGFTLSSVLDAWVVISRISLLLLETLKHRLGDREIHDGPTHGWLPQFAPVLQINALTDAMAAATGLSSVQSAKLVEFLTFRGGDEQEIWSQPLIPVGEKTLAPTFAAISSPNLRRLVDIWMRQAGIDLAKRGPAFESHIRRVVVDAIEESAILSHVAKSFDEAYTFRPVQGVAEEIDLVLSIGSKVFIVEVKCILEPTDANAIAMHHRTVVGAADQVQRKVAVIQEYREIFVTDVLRHGMVLPENFTIEPLVLISTCTHVGVPVNGVPVIDELILNRYLMGELEELAVRGGELVAHARRTTILYADGLEAEAHAVAYFSSPPQLKRYFDGVSGRVVPIYSVDDADWKALMITLECKPQAGARLEEVIDERPAIEA